MKRPAAILSLASLLLLAASRPHFPTGEPLPELAPFVAGNTAFAFDLHRQLVQPGANLIFSPYSLTAALGLAQSGARGATEQQIATTLRFPAPPDLEAALARIRTSLTSGSPDSYESFPPKNRA